jgi:hypothetical protein
MSETREHWTLWVCTNCIMHHANGECGDCHNPDGHEGGEPLSKVDYTRSAAGMFSEEHDDTCMRKCSCTQDDDCEEHGETDPVTGDSRDSQHHDASDHVCPDDYECDCETSTFSTSTCDGCGSEYHGERHAMTEWSK